MSGRIAFSECKIIGWVLTIEYPTVDWKVVVDLKKEKKKKTKNTYNKYIK